MDQMTFPKTTLGELPDHAWVRLGCGDVGVIHDRINKLGYAKVCVEVPGSRQPIRILTFDTVVEHVSDRGGVPTPTAG